MRHFFTTVHHTSQANFSRKTVVGLLFVFAGGCTSSAQELLWAKQFGAYNPVVMRSDANGDLISTGQFVNTTDFDAGPLTNTLSAVGFADVFITKCDSAGSFMWAKRIGGFQSEEPRAMALDAEGNIYITGIFNGTCDMNPGAATNNVVSLGNTDIFMVKLDANGNYQWSKSIGTTVAESALAMAVDTSGSVYVGGFFGNLGGAFGVTMDMDPGNGVSNVSTSGNINDGFLLKLNTDGNFEWGKHYPGGSAEVGGLVITPDNKVVVAGTILGYMDLDETDAIWPIIDEIFVCWYNQDGSFHAAKTIEAYSTLTSPNVLTIDSNHHLHMAGTLSLPADFAPQNAGNYVIDGSGQKGYVWECTSDGSFVSAGVFSTSSVVRDITADAQGNKYITGSFYLPTDFDFSDSTFTLTSNGSMYNVFLVKYDANDSLLWGHSYGGFNTPINGTDETGRNLILMGNEELYTFGSFAGEVDFDLQADTSTMNATGGKSFIAKYAVPIPDVPNDLNNDGQLDIGDLLLLIENFGCVGCPDLDLDGDGIITMTDLLLMIDVLG